MGGDQVSIDPDALIAFAQGIAPATNELYGQAMSTHLVSDLMELRSSLPGGLSFVGKQMEMANEFSAFMMDAAVGCVSLAYAANLIAINVTVTDETSAAELTRLIEQVRAQGKLDPKQPVQVIDVSGLQQQRSGAEKDIRGAFTPRPQPKETDGGGARAKPGDGKITSVAEALRVAEAARRRQVDEWQDEDTERQRHAGDLTPQTELIALQARGEDAAETVTKIAQGYCFLPPERTLPFPFAPQDAPENPLAPNKPQPTNGE